MTEKKRLILNLFEMNCVSHITHGLWRLPDNNRERFNDIEYWLELELLDGRRQVVFASRKTPHRVAVPEELMDARERALYQRQAAPEPVARVAITP